MNAISSMCIELREKYVLLKAIQRSIRVMHFILFHDCICGKHTVADSDVQMASRLHPL